MKNDLYEIGYHLEREPGRAGWPYVVWYYPSREPPFTLGEGVEVGSGSANLSARELLESTWHEHLELTNCLWLLPLARRMADGEVVTMDEVLDGYASIHGQRPEPNHIQQAHR